MYIGIFDSIECLLGVCALLRVCRACCSVYRALLRVFRAILRAYRAFLGACRTLLSVFGKIQSVCRALLSVHSSTYFADSFAGSNLARIDPAT